MFWVRYKLSSALKVDYHSLTYRIKMYISPAYSPRDISLLSKWAFNKNIAEEILLSKLLVMMPTICIVCGCRCSNSKCLGGVSYFQFPVNNLENCRQRQRLQKIINMERMRWKYEK